MINTRIFEVDGNISGPAFARPLSLMGTAAGARTMGTAARAETMGGARRAALAVDSLFALLERLKLCHTPRILSAQCVPDNTMNRAAPRRP